MINQMMSPIKDSYKSLSTILNNKEGEGNKTNKLSESIKVVDIPKNETNNIDDILKPITNNLSQLKETNPEKTSDNLFVGNITNSFEEMSNQLKETNKYLPSIVEKMSNKELTGDKNTDNKSFNNATTIFEEMSNRLKENYMSLPSFFEKMASTTKNENEGITFEKIAYAMDAMKNQVKDSDKSLPSLMEELKNRNGNTEIKMDDMGLEKLTSNFSDTVNQISKRETTTSLGLTENKIKPTEENSNILTNNVSQLINQLQKSDNKLPTLIDNLSVNTNKEPIKTISTPIKPSTLETNNLTIPTTITANQTQKHEFGKLEISVKVDIPNRPEIPTEHIKNVLETTMRSTDFQQSLVSAVNKAKTDFGATAKGGTSNYGNNLTSYGLNA